MTSVDRAGLSKQLLGSVVRAALPMLCVVMLSAGVFACRQAGGNPNEWLLFGETMGTSYHIKVTPGPAPPLDKAALQGSVAAVLEEINAKMSTWREDSELSRFNRAGGGEPFALSPDTAEVFRIALRVSEETGGAFDITVGPLVNAWGFGPEAFTQPPSGERLAELRAHVGFDKLRWAGEASIVKADSAVYCDLSAVAKGYAVDQVALLLEAEGFKDYMVEVGGELRAAGKNGKGKTWRIGIERPDPESAGMVQHILPLDGLGLATSGDYRNFREYEGKRFSHTIDPRTGKPVEHGLASASVLHASCARADAYATALMVLGPEAAEAKAKALGLSVLLVEHAGEGYQERATGSFVRVPDQAPSGTGGEPAE